MDLKLAVHKGKMILVQHAWVAHDFGRFVYDLYCTVWNERCAKSRALNIFFSLHFLHKIRKPKYHLLNGEDWMCWGLFRSCKIAILQCSSCLGVLLHSVVSKPLRAMLLNTVVQGHQSCGPKGRLQPSGASNVAPRWVSWLFSPPPPPGRCTTNPQNCLDAVQRHRDKRDAYCISPCPLEWFQNSEAACKAQSLDTLIFLL